MDIRFLMAQNIFLQEYFKIIQYLQQLRNTLNILVALLKLIRENIMEYQKKILKIYVNQTAILHQLLLIIMFCQIYFNEHCLVNNNISIPKIVINLYIFYILNPRLSKLNTDFALKNCLFGSVKLTKNADLDK